MNNNLYTLINNFVPSVEQEVVDKQLFLEYIKSFDNILLRDNTLCHITSSAFVVNHDKTKVVSAYHNIYKSWGWLGGHADGDEDLLHVAKKEIMEESGLNNITLLTNGIYSLECLPVLSHTKKGAFVSAHLHLNVTYVFVANENEPIRILPDENSQIAWIPINDIVKLSTENFMQTIYQKIIDKLAKEKI